MNKLFENILTKIIRKEFEAMGKRRVALKTIHKEIHKKTVALYHALQDSIFIVLWAISASFALNAFLLPNSFIDGGVTGISLIINELTTLSLFYSLWSIFRLLSSDTALSEEILQLKVWLR